MSSTLQSLGIDRLSRDERIVLVQELWKSIAAEPAPSRLTDAQKRELDRRLDEDDAAPEDVVPWEEVKARILAQLQR